MSLFFKLFKVASNGGEAIFPLLGPEKDKVHHNARAAQQRKDVHKGALLEFVELTVANCILHSQNSI